YTSLFVVFFCSSLPTHTYSTLFPYTTLFRSLLKSVDGLILTSPLIPCVFIIVPIIYMCASPILLIFYLYDNIVLNNNGLFFRYKSEEHTSELQSRFDLVCRLLLEKKKKYKHH